MKVAIGSDHAGFRMKETIKMVLSRRKIEFIDVGPDSEDSVDYPDFAHKVARLVASGECERGILICGTGIGMSITANKVKGIRAAVAHNMFTARMAAAHNNANILCFGARVVPEDLACDMVESWLEEKFEGGRHARRVDKISQIESEECK